MSALAICDEIIALQKLLDDRRHVALLQGRSDDAEAFLTARKLIYRQAESLTTIARLAKGEFPMESDR